MRPGLFANIGRPSHTTRPPFPFPSPRKHVCLQCSTRLSQCAFNTRGGRVGYPGKRRSDLGGPHTPRGRPSRSPVLASTCASSAAHVSAIAHLTPAAVGLDSQEKGDSLCRDLPDTLAGSVL